MTAPLRWGAVARLLAAGVGLAILSSVSAAASELDREITFHIAPQALEGALLEFSRQADIQVAFESASIRDVEVPGVDGKLVASAALLVLLRGSGLSYSVRGSTVTVTRVAAKPKQTEASVSPAHDPHSTPLPHPRSTNSTDPTG